jgi:aminotransferase
VIREFTRLADEHNAINLAQGYPDFAALDQVKEAGVNAIRDDYNQYSFTWGSPDLLNAIAKKAKRYNGIDADPQKNVTVTCGSTEAMMAAMLAIIDPGDEVIIFEPFYENYGPDSTIVGAKPRFVRLREPEWRFEEERLKEAFGKKTKAIIINTPHNPTGKVYQENELKLIADLCEEYDAVAVTDEIYEHIVYGVNRHKSMATVGNMADRTITISGLSKTFSVTGWRIGYAIADKRLTDAFRKVHDYLTICAPSPLQEAAARALELPQEYYESLREFYDKKRRLLISALSEIGFRCYDPQGAYYIMTDISGLGYEDDVKFANWLVKNIRVAAVPGSSFYSKAQYGKTKLRFTFSKKNKTLLAAIRRLKGVKRKTKS